MRSSNGMLPIPIKGILWVNMPGISIGHIPIPIPIPVLISEWMVEQYQYWYESKAWYRYWNESSGWYLYGFIHAPMHHYTFGENRSQ